MRTLCVLGLVFIVLCGGMPHAAQAQPPAAPLVIVMDQEVWTWAVGDGALTQLTQDAAIQTAALAPDGTRLAVSAWSPISVDAVARVGGIGGGPLPADISVIDLATGAITVIAPQPADASFFVDGVPDNALLRSAPTWSPDGSQMAWTELHYPEEDPALNRLLVADLATSETRVIVTDLPEGVGVRAPLDVAWGRGGIALYVPSIDQATGTYPVDFMFYDPAGSLIARSHIPDDGEHIVMSFTWATGDDQDWLVVEYGSGTFDVIDPTNGTRRALQGGPVLVSRAAPESSVQVGWLVIPGTPYGEDSTWLVTYPDGTSPAVLDYHGRRVVIAPDRQTLASLDLAGTLTLWVAGEPQAVPVTLEGWVAALFWEPTDWRVDPAQIGAPSETVTCPGAPLSRLAVGSQGRVIPNTSPNNLRDAVGGPILGQIMPGEVFTVLAGPQCADGLAWWQVDAGDRIGWTAEGDAGSYWLEPIG